MNFYIQCASVILASVKDVVKGVLMAMKEARVAEVRRPLKESRLGRLQGR